MQAMMTALHPTVSIGIIKSESPASPGQKVHGTLGSCCYPGSDWHAYVPTCIIYRGWKRVLCLLLWVSPESV